MYVKTRNSYIFLNYNLFIKQGYDSHRRTIERFSRVTNFLKDAFLGQNEILSRKENLDEKFEPDITALMESFNTDIVGTNNDGFEVIYKVLIVFRI